MYQEVLLWYWESLFFLLLWLSPGSFFSKNWAQPHKPQKYRIKIKINLNAT